MLNDMAWRKTPRDLLTNPRIRSIAGRIDAHLKQAVFAFYAACYMEADDDGVIRLDDNEVFADLLMLEDEGDIDRLTALFVKKGFLEEMKDGRFLISDWDNPNMATFAGNKRISESAEQRRARICGAAKPAKRPKTAERHTEPPAQDAAEETHEERTLGERLSDEALAAASGDFFCPENGAESATKFEKVSRKIENSEKCATLFQKVSRKIAPTEREEREIRESREENLKIESGEETHTLSSANSFSAPVSSACASDGAGDSAETEAAEISESTDEREGAKRAQEITDNAERNGSETQESSGGATDEMQETIAGAESQAVTKTSGGEAEAQQSLSAQKPTGAQWSFEDTKKAIKEMQIPESVAARFSFLSGWDNWHCLSVFYAFFKKKCPIDFTKSEVELNTIRALIADCATMAEPKNPSYVIAGQICAVFDDLIGNRGVFRCESYFKTMKHLPQNTKKPSVWARIYPEIKKRLSPGKVAGETWEKNFIEYASEVEKEREKLGGATFLENEMRKRGLDPQKNGSLSIYCMMISAEQREKKRDNSS